MQMDARQVGDDEFLRILWNEETQIISIEWKELASIRPHRGLSRRDSQAIARGGT